MSVLLNLQPQLQANYPEFTFAEADSQAAASVLWGPLSVMIGKSIKMVQSSGLEETVTVCWSLLHLRHSMPLTEVTYRYLIWI